MAMPRVAINGFGRIGRLSFRANIENPVLDVVAINDLGGPVQAAHMLKYDSVFGRFNGTVEARENSIVVNGKEIKVFSERDPEQLPWAQENIDVVLECTGVFRKMETASLHIKAGAKLVVVSAPGKGEVPIPTYCYGVNHESYTPDQSVISNASCTTNCLAPLAKVIDREYGIKNAMVTTVHAYTSSQALVDAGHKDLRRSRAAALSAIPAKTGATRAVGLVLPQLQGKFFGMAVRIPLPTVSLVDLVVNLEKPTTAEEVNEVFKKAAASDLKGVLEVNVEPLVSVDFQGNPHSSIVDADYTRVLDGTTLKVLAWYDNEWGYSNRLNEMAAFAWQKKA